MTLPSASASIFIYHARHCSVPGIRRDQTIIFEKCAAKEGKKIQVFIFYIQTNISLKIVLMVKRCIFGDFGVKDHSNISHHLTVHIMVVTGSG